MAIEIANNSPQTVHLARALVNCKTGLPIVPLYTSSCRPSFDCTRESSPGCLLSPPNENVAPTGKHNKENRLCSHATVWLVKHGALFQGEDWSKRKLTALCQDLKCFTLGYPQTKDTRIWAFWALALTPRGPSSQGLVQGFTPTFKASMTKGTQAVTAFDGCVFKIGSPRCLSRDKIRLVGKFRTYPCQT